MIDEPSSEAPSTRLVRPVLMAGCTEPTDVEVRWNDDWYDIRCTFEGRTVAVKAESFDNAIGQFVEQLPAAKDMTICYRCKLAAVDPFSGSNGFDDLSCYRREPALMADLLSKGRRAGAQTVQYLGRFPVTAFDTCQKFSLRDRPL